VTDLERALALVRAARRQLESLRVLRGASRGALLAAALGLLLILLDYAAPGAALPAALAWWLTLAGALAGVAATLVRPSIPAAAAAIYLDQRCDTQERFVTIWSLPLSEYAPEWAGAVAGVSRVPRLPLPRESSLVPVALFLLMAAGLLPAASADTPMEIARIGHEATVGAASDSTNTETDSGEQVDEAAKTLRKQGALSATAIEEIERAIESAFPRPEEREVARAELVKARAGNREARERLSEALLKGAGVLAESDSPVGSSGSPAARSDSEHGRPSPYPGEAAYLRAYDVELARLLRKGK